MVYREHLQAIQAMSENRYAADEDRLVFEKQALIPSQDASRVQFPFGEVTVSADSSRKELAGHQERGIGRQKTSDATTA